MKQLDPRWARKGVTAALLKAAGYSTDVAAHTEFVGDLPAHLSCRNWRKSIVQERRYLGRPCAKMGKLGPVVIVLSSTL